MNEIEQMFYDAFLLSGEESENIRPQCPIGIYFADFVLYPQNIVPVIVEIDGHESHKTKEQRFIDYQRERFFVKNGFFVIRFTGSEVYVNAEACSIEAIEIAKIIDERLIDIHEKGYRDGIDEAKRVVDSGFILR